MPLRMDIRCAAAALVAVVVALYAQTFGFDFLRFDDPDYTFRCPFVQGGLSAANVAEAFRNARHGAIWMPLTWISYMLDISLFGPHPCGHHAVNVLLHALNALLLFGLTLQLAARCAPDLPPAACRWRHGVLAFLVAFWTIHPQRVEAVAWIASRKELLWSAFALAGLSCWLAGKRWRAYAFCALSCMSKPTALVFPLLAALVALLPRMAHPPAPRPSFRRALPPYLPLIALSLATGALAVYSQTHPEGMATKDLFYAGLPERLLNAAVAIGLYLFQMALPLGLHLDYRAVPGAWPVDGALGLAAFVAFLAVLAFAARRRTVPCRTMLWGGGWFFAALLPTLGIFGSFGEHARADRFVYVAAMALPLAGAAFCGVQAKRPVPFALLGLAWLLLLGIQTARLTATCRNDLTAFSRALACDPDHGRALAHVGEARCAAGALDEGIGLLRRSRAQRPRPETDGKLAYALMRRGRAADWQEIREVCAPFAADPARDAKGQALEALGTAELKAREWQRAAEHLSRSILAPARFYSSADAKLKLAFAWHNSGRRTDARKLFEAVSRSSRADLAARADQVLSVLDTSPNALLFW